MSGNIVSVDEESLRNDIENLVRRTVRETLNALPFQVFADAHGRQSAVITMNFEFSRWVGRSQETRLVPRRVLLRTTCAHAGGSGAQKDYARTIPNLLNF